MKGKISPRRQNIIRKKLYQLGKSPEEIFALRNTSISGAVGTGPSTDGLADGGAPASIGVAR
jgi:hypothetical protein